MKTRDAIDGSKTGKDLLFFPQHDTRFFSLVSRGSHVVWFSFLFCFSWPFYHTLDGLVYTDPKKEQAISMLDSKQRDRGLVETSAVSIPQLFKYATGNGHG